MTQKQDQYALVQGGITNSYIGLYKALGGGWQIWQGKEYLPQETKEQMEQRTDWGNLLNAPSPEGQLP